LEHTLRSTVWKYIFKYYPWESTRLQRRKIKEDKREEYRSLKSRWETIDDEQATDFDEWSTRRDFIHAAVFQSNIGDISDNTVIASLLKTDEQCFV